jgi:hypothetical protein
MFAMHLRSTAGILITLAAVPGCVSATAPVKSPVTERQLQLVSAGHTGCLPADNAISNSNVNLSGTGTWNATCKSRIFLCSAVSSGNQAYAYSCAPAAQ